MSRTNNSRPIRASHLHYDRYMPTEYDRDIVRAIPGHAALHRTIGRYIKRRFSAVRHYHVLDLGCGTGLTANYIRRHLPKATLELIDFSQTMLSGARKRLGKNNVRYVRGDYTTHQFKQSYDIAVSVIGFHHQTDAGKRIMFKKIFSMLVPGGAFILADLMTYQDPRRASYEQARHIHHLVSHARNKKHLTDWAQHHLLLNHLTPVESQLRWLRQAGFRARLETQYMNTMLIVAEKPVK